MAKKKVTEEAIINDLVEATKQEVKEVAFVPVKKANCCCARCKAQAPAILNK